MTLVTMTGLFCWWNIGKTCHFWQNSINEWMTKCGWKLDTSITHGDGLWQGCDGGLILASIGSVTIVILIWWVIRSFHASWLPSIIVVAWSIHTEFLMRLCVRYCCGNFEKFPCMPHPPLSCNGSKWDRCHVIALDDRNHNSFSIVVVTSSIPGIQVTRNFMFVFWCL